MFNFNIVMWFLFMIITGFLGALADIQFSFFLLFRDITMIIGTLFLSDYMRENW
jgi:hypothetical protein